jgi:hypothetical protein
LLLDKGASVLLFGRTAAVVEELIETYSDYPIIEDYYWSRVPDEFTVSCCG